MSASNIIQAKVCLNFWKRWEKQHFMTYSIHQEVIYDFPRETHVKTPPLLHAPAKVAVSGKPLWMTSFSTLSQHFEYKAAERLAFIERILRVIMNVHQRCAYAACQ